jgi:hypothetical protein
VRLIAPQFLSLSLRLIAPYCVSLPLSRLDKSLLRLTHHCASVIIESQFLLPLISPYCASLVIAPHFLRAPVLIAPQFLLRLSPYCAPVLIAPQSLSRLSPYCASVRHARELMIARISFTSLPDWTVSSSVSSPLSLPLS